MAAQEAYELIKSFIFNLDGNIDSNKNTFKYLKKHYRSVYEYLHENFPDIKNVSEFLWLYEHDFYRPRCKVCGKLTSFLGYKAGYRNLFCSNACRITKAGMKYWRDRGKETCIKKYGSPYPFQSKIVQDKVNENTVAKYGTIRPKDAEWQTKIKNGTISSSKIQKEVEKYLKERFPDTLGEYKEERYPYHCDFYIPSLDLFIEIQAHWTHNNHKYVCDCPDDRDVLEIWESKAQSSQFYANAVDTWARRDVEKRETAKKNNLKYFEFFGNSLNEFIEKLSIYLESNAQIS